MLTGRRTAEDVERALVDGVAGLLEAVFAGLQRVRADVELVLATGARDRASLGPVEAGAAELLTRPDRLVAGAGYVAQPEFLSDAPYWLEWWTARPGGPERLARDVDAESGAELDYARQPWLVTPRETGRRHVTGPYVDYVCTDEYTLTLSVPVQAQGAFAGIVGADVYVRSLEEHTADLHALPGAAALVNAQGRVIVGTGGLVSGALVRSAHVPSLWSTGEPVVRDGATTLRRCPGDLPLGLLSLG